MTTFLVCGDPHFKINNIPDVNLFMEKFINVLKEKKPDFCIVLGDLLHTHERLHTIPLNKAYEFINKIKKLSPVYILVGNHDMINNQQFLNSNHWMNGMKHWKNVTIVDKVINLKHKEKEFLFVPYVPNGKFIEALNTYETWKNCDAIFAHQEFQGCSMNAITSIDGDKWDEKYPNVISGHIHAKQHPQKNIYYTGSAMQHAFGESTKNIIAFISFSSQIGYDLQEIDLKLPRKKIIHTTVEELEEEKENEMENKFSSGDKIKISITGNYDKFKTFKKTKKYKELLEKGAKVIFKPKKLTLDEKDSQDPEEEIVDFKEILRESILNEKDKYLFSDYENIVNNKNISPSEVLFT